MCVVEDDRSAGLFDRRGLSRAAVTVASDFRFAGSQSLALGRSLVNHIWAKFNPVGKSRHGDPLTCITGIIWLSGESSSQGFFLSNPRRQSVSGIRSAVPETLLVFHPNLAAVRRPLRSVSGEQPTREITTNDGKSSRKWNMFSVNWFWLNSDSSRRCWNALPSRAISLQPLTFRSVSDLWIKLRLHDKHQFQGK